MQDSNLRFSGPKPDDLNQTSLIGDITCINNIMDNTDDYYTLIDLPIATEIIKAECISNINSDRFYTSLHGQCRINFSANTTARLSEVIPFSIFDAGMFKNIPGWDYAPHRDKDRLCALNMLVSDEDPGYEVSFYQDDGTKFLVPYVKYQWVLLNTKKRHGVQNKSLTSTRYCVSVGCTELDYYTVKNMLLKGGGG